MLRGLEIENLLLIERAELSLGGGLNVITGETGAGKTLLAAALGLLLGDRSRTGLVRPGADAARVEGRFDLPASLDDGLLSLLPDGETEIVLTREVRPDGRSRARICGRAATVSELRDLASALVSFHGQHEHRRLTLAGFQLATLDAACGPGQQEQLLEARKAHALVKELEERLSSLGAGGAGGEREADLLRWEIGEIEDCAVSADERAALAGERDLLRAADAIREALGLALGAMSAGDEAGSGIAAGVADAAARFERLGDAGGVLGDIPARLSALTVEIDDLAGEIRSQLDSLDLAPGRLDQVEQRLGQYQALERKHGGSIESVLAHASECRRRLAELDDLEGAIERCESELDAALAARQAVAERLSAARREAAGPLAERVESELSDLGLDGASFEVVVRGLDRTGPEGADRAEFVFAANRGIAPAPLGETASGGELSRVMLALLAGAGGDGGSGSRLLVFDEVDAGIGGRTAVAVGARLARLGEGVQVLCITHLAPVAARAGTHFRIDKRTVDGHARTHVAQLTGEELIGELVRMLGADEGDESAAEHARRLLAGAAPDVAD